MGRGSDSRADFPRCGEFEKWGAPEDEDLFAELYDLHGRLRELARESRNALRRSEGAETMTGGDWADQVSELRELLGRSVPPMSDIVKSSERVIEYAYPLGFASTVLSAVASALAAAMKDSGQERPLPQLLAAYVP